MIGALYNAILEWSRETDDRLKMQHTYLTVTILSVVVAGIVSLIDSKTGQDILTISFVAAIIYSINWALWIVLESTVLRRLAGKQKKRS